MPCNHEEADTRILLHIKNQSEAGHDVLKIQTVDTDVAIIATSIFKLLDVKELWMDFGVGKNKKLLPIHQYASRLEEQKCKALLFWYAFTACDTVSSFAGKGTSTCWDTWMNHEEIT